MTRAPRHTSSKAASRYAGLSSGIGRSRPGVPQIPATPVVISARSTRRSTLPCMRPYRALWNGFVPVSGDLCRLGLR